MTEVVQSGWMSLCCVADHADLSASGCIFLGEVSKQCADNAECFLLPSKEASQDSWCSFWQLPAILNVLPSYEDVRKLGVPPGES